jgi:hypothetical protein
MKKIILSVLSIFFIVFVFSQNDSLQARKDSLSNLKKYVLSNIDISSGKGAITSGTFCYLNLENKKSFLQITIGNDDVELTYLFRFFNDKILVGPNIGFFFNIPYAGPQLIFKPCKFVETFHWIGWSLGNPGEVINLKEAKFLFAINSVSINIWRFKTTYCLINYMRNKPQHTLTLKYSQPLNKKISIYVDAGWDFLNKNQLLKIGGSINL